MKSDTCLSHRSALTVDLVANGDKREVLRVTGTGLDQELVTPRIQILEAVSLGHVVHQHAAIRPTVEGDTEALEPLLASRVPYLDEQEDGKTKHCQQG